MRKIVQRSLQPISLEPIYERPGLILTIHGETPEGNVVTYLSLQEARLLAFGLLEEAERQTPE